MHHDLLTVLNSKEWDYKGRFFSYTFIFFAFPTNITLENIEVKEKYFLAHLT